MRPVAVDQLLYDRDTLQILVSVFGLLHTPVEQLAWAFKHSKPETSVGRLFLDFIQYLAV
jgi:hypothetical protein